MEKRKALRAVKAAFWPLVSLALVMVFVAVPIYKAGLWKYASDQLEINPFMGRVMQQYTHRQVHRLAAEWYDRVEVIRGGANPECEMEGGHRFLQGHPLAVVS